MISFATRRRPWLYIVTFLMLTLSLILLDSVHALDPLKNSAAGVVASWQIRAQAIGDHISVARSSTQSTEDLQAELDAVKKQRDQLLADDSRLIGLERENAMLRNEIGFQQAHPTYDMVAAQVVKNDHETPERVITIDCGTDKGVRVGMAVTTPEGNMAGIVDQVTARSAVVRLIIDQQVHVSAVVQETGDQGTIVGAWQQSKRLLLRDTGNQSGIAVGQHITSGGLTNFVVSSIPIGQVYSVKSNIVADSQEIEIVPYADFDTIRDVVVIRGTK